MSSFPSITEAKQRQLAERMEQLGLREADIEEKFIRGRGRGGQKLNKTSSCVHLLHKPTGTQVKCARERSQGMNRYFARRELCEKIEQARQLRTSEKQQAIEKIRRRKRKRSHRQKIRMLEDKRHQSRKKEARAPVHDE